MTAAAGDRFARWFPWAATALAAAVVVATHRDYGAQWDEGVTSRYGELALAYFRSGGADTACNDYIDLRFYGPLIEMLPALFYTADDLHKYEVRHLFLGLLSVLVLPAVWLVARLLDRRAAVLAVLAVAMMPSFYGQWFANSKDMPFAVLVTWFMAAVATMFARDALRWRDTVLCGVAMGLALCARSGGFPLFAFFLGGGAAVWLLTQPRRALGQAVAGLLPKLAAVVLLAWPIMVAPWPWAHQDPIGHPIEAMQVAAKFHTTMPVLFDGETYRSDQLPWYYVAKYLLITVPIAVLLLAAVGLAASIVEPLRDRRSARTRVLAITLLWLLAPVAAFAVLRPNVYGGMRHFLFVLPPLGVLAAYGGSRLLGWIRMVWLRRAASAVLAAVLLLPLIDMVRLHPYQMTFYNAFVGGVAGAQERYWTDYPLSSYCEAVRWVNARAAATPERRVVAAIAAPAMVWMWLDTYAADNVDLVSVRDAEPQESGAGADYYIGNTRNDQHLLHPEAPIVHAIGRAGAVFSVIRALR